MFARSAIAMCCHVLPCVAMLVAMCCHVLPCVAMCCHVLPCVADFPDRPIQCDALPTHSVPRCTDVGYIPCTLASLLASVVICQHARARVRVVMEFTSP
eukprot:67818-Prorocentrum_minimum.AAC.1